VPAQLVQIGMEKTVSFARTVRFGIVNPTAADVLLDQSSSMENAL
jgi:hypothetical protein